MENTIKKGKIRFLIYGYNGHYTGIGYELGLVESGNSAKEVQDRLFNGAKAIIATCDKEKLSKMVLNNRPPMKYALLFYAIPIVFSWLNFISKVRECFSLNMFDRSVTDLQIA